jgi:hypothetical protein
MYAAGKAASDKACYSGQDTLKGTFRQKKSDIGPGPKTPAGAPPPSSKGAIKSPKQVGR